MSYQTALFDLDGTLLDTIEDLKDAVNHELALEGDPLRSLEEITNFVGNGLRNLMLRALPDGRSEEEIDRRTASMKAYYSAHSRVKTRPYPGMAELLRELRAAGVAVAVVSNKADSVVKALCEGGGCGHRPECRTPLPLRHLGVSAPVGTGGGRGGGADRQLRGAAAGHLGGGLRRGGDRSGGRDHPADGGRHGGRGAAGPNPAAR